LFDFLLSGRFVVINTSRQNSAYYSCHHDWYYVSSFVAVSLQIAESLAVVSILAFLVANVLLVADTIPVGVAPVAFHLFGATDIRPDGVATTASNGGSSIFDSVKARYLSKEVCSMAKD